MLRYDIRTIPHKKHPYPTVGNYWDAKGVEHIRVSNMGNKVYEFLVAIHEMVEKLWCELNGVAEKDITEFDIRFEKKREASLKIIETRQDSGALLAHKAALEAEPGDDPEAPYFTGHQIATMVERLVAFLFGVDWNKYSERIFDL